MPDRDLITNAQIQHSLASPRCHGTMEPPAPLRSVAACEVCGFEDYTEWPVAQDRTAELEQAHARITELEKVIEEQLTEIGDKGARITALKAAVAGLQAGPVHTPDRCSFREGAKCVCNTSLQEMVNARIADIARIAAERDKALARIVELEQQSDPKAVERFDALMRLLDRCRATTTPAFVPEDHRAVWCVLPNGHAGMHHGELPQDGVDFPMILDWAEVE